MPELPEVEAVARTLRPLVRGRKIRGVYVLHPITTKPQKAADLARFAATQTIRDVTRHGKYLVLELNRGILTMHFRLDGQLLWFTSAAEMEEKANRAPHNVHVDVGLEFDRGVLGFADRRHFGRVHFFESREASKGLRSLGIDALSKEFTPKAFQCIARGIAAFAEGISARSEANCGYWEYLLMRIHVASAN
jgi:formamidopyrimidine-DNA glycosylase